LEAPRQQGGLRALAGRGSTSSFGASEDEVALAGRGFNDKVEAKYKEQTKLDFSQVDRMEEEFGQPVDALGEFLATADLTLGEADE